jgi:P22 coat protein - gene protein 5
MATITNVIADQSGFLPQTWALEALNVLRNSIVLARNVAKDVDYEEAGWVGKALNIPYPGTFTAQDKTAGNPVTAQAPNGGATVSLTLSKHKVVDFLVEDAAAAQSNADLLQRYVQPAVVALAEQFESDLFAVANALQGGVVGTAGVNLTASTLYAARRQLNINKAPQTDRFAIVSPKDEIALLQDSTLATFFAFSRPEDIEEGMIAKPIAGFKPYMSQIVPQEANNQIQIVTITGSPTGGTFTITFGGQTTGNIAFNASPVAVQTALISLISIESGNVIVSGVAGGPYTIEFTNALATAATAITASATGLTGGTSPNVAVTQPTNVTQNLALHKDAIMYAMRPFAPIAPSSGVATATVTDEESGLSIRVLKQYNPQYRAEYVGFDILYGMVALRPSLGVVMLS